MAGVRKTAGHQTAEAAGLQIVKVNWNFALVPLYVPVVAASVVAASVAATVVATSVAATF